MLNMRNEMRYASRTRMSIEKTAGAVVYFAYSFPIIKFTILHGSTFASTASAL